MATQQQINSAAESFVSAWLIRNGYRTNLDIRQAGAVDFEAVGSKASLFVEVKVAVSPNAPPDLSAEELERIKKKATSSGYQAWLAKVTVDSEANPVGEIGWRRLV